MQWADSAARGYTTTAMHLGLASKEELGDSRGAWRRVTKIIKELENRFRGDILGTERAIT